MPKPSSTVFGTLILTISLFSLQATLWYFRPQHPGRTSSHLGHGIGNVRKLLKADSAENQQQFMWLVFLFITLGLTADDYFCPSLAVICETLGVSQNIAGVTFLAFGNGAPDIFSALAAYSQSKNQTGVQLGMQALFVIVTLLSLRRFEDSFKLCSCPFLFQLISLIFERPLDKTDSMDEMLPFSVRRPNRLN